MAVLNNITCPQFRHTTGTRAAPVIQVVGKEESELAADREHDGPIVTQNRFSGPEIYQPLPAYGVGFEPLGDEEVNQVALLI